MRRFAYSVLFIAVIANAQSINIGNFYYRDYLDFGQNKGAFSGNGSTTIMGKDGKEFTIPQTPNFSASSNYGSLTSVGRGFAVTANHVTSPESVDELRQWGLTKYDIANETVTDSKGNDINGISKPYGRDEKFLRFNKYIVEGQTSMLNIANSTKQGDTASTASETQNLKNFKAELEKLKDSSGNVYIYQAGSGIMDLRWSDNPIKNINLPQDGSMKGGGFGILNIDSSGYQNLVQVDASGDSRGIWYFYNPNSDFNNRITSGDSGSGIYAYDSTNQKWILLGVTSRATSGVNRAEVSFVSNKDFVDYQKNFEQKIDLQNKLWTLNGNALDNNTLSVDQTIQGNKDIIFSGGGTIQVEKDIDRTQSGYAGGFVFVAGDTATSTNPTTYKFTNANGKTHSFKGSGLDIGQNVVVEWALGTQKGDSLHKIGKGELKITDSKGDNGTLKIGEGKVTLDTNTKAFDNIYITSGRGELALKAGKAEALGATKNGTTSANTINSGATSATSYTLAQDSTDKMGFYFGKGGGKFDLAGNSLVLNTIAANDSGAIITSTSATKATLEIQGLGYDSSGNKKTTKENTIIHASIGDSNSTNSANQANIDIIHNGDTKNDSAHLIFDGNINTSGKLSANKTNIALQGHATA
ncbi:S6 family peptidase, partial [Helicobacter fennelliae]|uniref:S6 family peptidase n=1 Tax=Helicobacter fennelliae TaxID=215 RepID=UPI00272E1A0B